MNHHRRTFLRGLAYAAAAPLISITANAEQHKFMQERPLPLNADLVLDFVRSAHRDLERVKELLDKEPNLLNATWDWGKGDFESGIGGAGHMGLTEIAEYLIAKGARMDIFVATMLGKMDIVRPMLDAFPNLKTSKGPHGITLLAHAEKGGEKAKSMLEYLQSIGAS